MNKMLKQLLMYTAAFFAVVFLLLITFFHFSYEEVPYKDVYILKIEPDLYEVAFKYRAIVYGNMHGPSLPFSKNSDHDEVAWFYLRKNEGTIGPDDIIFTHYHRCRDPLYWQHAMKGTILISGSSVTFDLKIPDYVGPDGRSTNTIQRYRDWQNNGKYNLVTSLPSDLPTEPSDYRPESCDDVSKILPEYRYPHVSWNPL